MTARSVPLWRRALSLMGLGHVRHSLEGADALREPARRRATGVLVAARGGLRETAGAFAVPWPESVVCVRVDDVDVVCVHVPNAANGWVKVETLTALRAGLQAALPGRRIVCGDLNTPRREGPDGAVMSFARDSRGRLRPERGPEWDAAELGIVPGLRTLGYRDAYRSLHGYVSREPSWTWRQIAGHSGGWRLDHIFVSSGLEVTSCTYHHAWRDDGLSDHSALEADVMLAGGSLDERPA